MRTDPSSEEHRTASPTPWRVLSVEPLPAYRLFVRFADGLTGTVDALQLVHSDRAGVFAALADQETFAAVYVEDGAITWNGGLDLAPDAMYDAIRQHGVWTI